MVGKGPPKGLTRWNLRFFTCLKFGKSHLNQTSIVFGFKMKKNQGRSGGIFPRCVGYPPEFMKCLDGVNLKVKMWYFWWFPVKVNGTLLISTISKNL